MVMAVRQAEAGAQVADICPKLGIAETAYHGWKKKIEPLGVSEVLELRQLRHEHKRLKSVVADPGVHEMILKEALQ